MKRFIPILFLASFSSPAMADIVHQISASTQLRVDAAASSATRIGSTYSVSGNNIKTTQTTTGSGNSAVTTQNLGGLTAISAGVTPSGGGATTYNQTHAAPQIQGDYEINTAGDAFSFTESFVLGDAVDNDGTTVQDHVHSGSATVCTAGCDGDSPTNVNVPAQNNYGVVTALPAFGNVSTTAGGYTGALAGTINSGGTITLTAGGAGTTATGQVTSTLTIK